VPRLFLTLLCTGNDENSRWRRPYVPRPQINILCPRTNIFLLLTSKQYWIISSASNSFATAIFSIFSRYFFIRFTGKANIINYWVPHNMSTDPKISDLQWQFYVKLLFWKVQVQDLLIWTAPWYLVKFTSLHAESLCHRHYFCGSWSMGLHKLTCFSGRRLTASKYSTIIIKFVTW